MLAYPYGLLSLCWYRRTRTLSALSQKSRLMHGVFGGLTRRNMQKREALTEAACCSGAPLKRSYGGQACAIHTAMACEKVN